MTTKEKRARKKAAKRHRNETPAVIRLGKESDDLIEAATLKADVMTEENPGGTSLPVIDDAPPVGEPITETPQRSPTNEELATAMQAAADAGEFDADPFEVWFVERCDAAKNWLATLPSKLGAVHDFVINKWIAFGNYTGKAVDRLYDWSHSKNEQLKQKLAEMFPPKVTRAELIEVVGHMGKYILDSQEEVKQMIASKNTVDRGRLDSLLFALQAKQKVRAVKLYASLTGSELGTAKEAIEALG